MFRVYFAIFCYMFRVIYIYGYMFRVYFVICLGLYIFGVYVICLGLYIYIRVIYIYTYIYI